jgi:hypothetical protein
MLGVRHRDQRGLGAALCSTAKRLGIPVSYDFNDAIPCVFNDVSALKLAETNHPRFMDRASFLSATDRLLMTDLGIPVLPTHVDPSYFQGPIFLKHRRTYKRYKHLLCYTGWQSAGEMLQQHGAAFLEYQKNPDPLSGELIAQPLLSYPTQDLDVNFSVNADGDIFVFAALDMRYASPGKAKIIVSCELPGQIKDRVTHLCKLLKIKGGFHNVDFVWFDGEWRLVDWNARLPLGMALRHAGDVGFLDDAMLHMCGKPVINPTIMHFEHRGYSDAPIAQSRYGEIVAAGAFPRMDGSGIQSVSIVTSSPEGAKAVYDFLGI